MKNPFVPNELYRSLTSICGLNPFLDTISSSRIQMYGSHLGQKLVVAGMEEGYVLTGVERELAKSTFSVKMPCRGMVLEVIPRYEPGNDKYSVAHTPEVVVIYEDDQTRKIDALILPQYFSYHPYFGYRYNTGKGISQLTKGAWIDKDTTFLDSPGVTEDGSYKYGVPMNMAFMSHPATSEDGIVISRDVLDKLKFRIYETRVVEWGKKSFPLNLYGDPKDPLDYKPFPDIGDVIRDDNLLMALRQYDTNLSVVEQDIHSVRNVNMVFDDRVYANGAGGRVIDIKVTTNTELSNGLSPTDAQLEKYIMGTQKFYKRILQTWKKLQRERGNTLSIGNNLHSLVMQSLISNEDQEGNRTSKQYKRAPIDDFRVEFTIEYEITPKEGFKLTGLHGNKGVICHVCEPHEMPVDDAGNRADIIMDPYSIVNRMTMGPLYEQYLSAASRDVGKHIRELLGIQRWDRHAKQKVTKIFETNKILFDEAYNYLVGYYRLTSPKMEQWYFKQVAELTADELISHVAGVVYDHVRLYMPPEGSLELVDVVKAVQKHYPPFHSQITYTGFSGIQCRTEEKVRIGPVLMMLLEKTGDDWSAVDSAKVQHHGVLAKLTRGDKYSEAWRPQPNKTVGETEFRIFAANTGRFATAELMDRNNNPKAHREAVKSILYADKPTDIKTLVDRTKVPYGATKPLQHFNHVAFCGGWRFKYNSLKNLPRSVTSIMMPIQEEVKGK